MLIHSIHRSPEQEVANEKEPRLDSKFTDSQASVHSTIAITYSYYYLTYFNSLLLVSTYNNEMKLSIFNKSQGCVCLSDHV